MRDYLQFYVNGQTHQVRGADAFSTLSDFLRHRLGLTATKIVCSEGDCGACTVLLGRPNQGAEDNQVYMAVDSCILFLHQLDGTDIVTVEGLSSEGKLHPMQQAMVDHFGSQCGFCTPGFVAAMTVHAGRQSVANTDEAVREEWQAALTGNLCRCTGYVQILEAAEAGAAGMRRMAVGVVENESAERETIEIVWADGQRQRRILLPTSLMRAAEFKSRYPRAVIVNGATDIGVLSNKHRIGTDVVLSLANVRDANAIVDDGKEITFSARTTWADVECWAERRMPEFHRIIVRFGSPQIRNLSTVIGNVANGSPIADSLPLLFVMDANLELLSSRGSRTVAIQEFYQGYKQMDLADDELIAGVRMRMPTADQRWKLYKVSKRRDLDISTFTAAICIRQSKGMIDEAKIAYGGVGPMVVRLPRTEAELAGKPFAEKSFRQAGQLARAEITPISDVRGSADFRRQLAENILLKFYYETM